MQKGETDPGAMSRAEFGDALAREQDRLQSFVRSLVFDHAAAADVYQEACLSMWNNFDSYDPTRPFNAWATGVARNHVLKYYRSTKRDQHVFSEEVVQRLAEEAEELAAESDPRLAALQACLAKLSPRERELIDRFYRDRHSADQIAEHRQRSVHAVYKALKVVRRKLMNCVNEGTKP